MEEPGSHGWRGGGAEVGGQSVCCPGRNLGLDLRDLPPLACPAAGGRLHGHRAMAQPTAASQPTNRKELP